MPTSGASVEVRASPADGGRDRLVQVHDVEIARAQLPPQRRDSIGVWARFDTAPLDGQPMSRPERHQPLGDGALLRPRAAVQEGGTPDVRIERREHAHVKCPADSSAVAKASMCRVTPPGYVQEYGETRATRISDVILRGLPEGSRSANPL